MHGQKLCGLLFAAAIIQLSASAFAQTFTVDTPLLTARWRQTATLLPNGLILIAGGETANDFGTGQIERSTSECELYSPVTSSSVQTTSMLTTHFGAGAALLTNGLALVAGGQANDGYTSTFCELYNPENESWSETGSLLVSAQAMTFVSLADGRFMSIGGLDDSFVDVNNTEIYSANTGVWTNSAPLTYACDSACAVLLSNGDILVSGGSYNGGSLTNSAIYNPLSNTWVNTGPLTVPRNDHAGVLLPNGNVLVIGGDNSAETFNPATRQWTAVASMNVSRYVPTLTLLPDGTALAIGGNAGENTAEIYNSASNTWTLTTNMTYGRLYHTATLVQGQVVVAGGDAGTIGFFNGPSISNVETFNQLPQYNPYGIAMNTTNLNWFNTGDSSWFIESTNNDDGGPAIQSGSITNYESSVLEVTFTGPGTFTFDWSCVANDTNGGYNCECDLDGNYIDSISGDTDWYQENPFSIPVGTHTVSWTATANGDTDFTEAAFLDNVSFALEVPPPSPGAWTVSGTITNTPIYATSTLLPNGKVLLCGGSDYSGNALASAQLYNPATGQWTATTALHDARYGHTATLLNNGTVLVVGGTTDQYGGADTVGQTEIFNPANSSWSIGSPLHYPRFFHTATVLANGNVLVSGGMGPNGTNVTPTNVYPAEIYNPSTGTWNVTGSLQTGRSSHTATLLQNGQVLVAGGNVPSRFLVTGAAELYDPTAGTWSSTAPMPVPLAYHTATLLPDGQVLVAGGDSDIGFIGTFDYYAVQSSELFDPATQTWSSSGNMVGPHDNHTATLLPNGLVLVAGTSAYAYNATNSAELYNPADGQWTAAAQLNFPRYRHTATLLANGDVLVAGGQGNSGLVPASELYSSNTIPRIILVNALQLPGGGIQFSWANTHGSTNTVVATTDPTTPMKSWTTLGLGTEVSSGQFQYVDKSTNGIHTRFYGVISP